MPSSLLLGQSANLLFGYQPTWNPSGSSYPFFAPPVASTVTLAPSFTPPEFTNWSATPVITLHDSATDLLSGLYRYKVAAMALDPAGADVPAGPLALGDADSAAAIAAVGAYLGLDLTGKLSYMLVTFERVSGTAQHPYVADPSNVDRGDYLTPAARKMIDALVPAQAPVDGSVLYDSKLSKADAAAYVAALYQLGTHFVSEITAGDVLVQVFAYDDAHFKILRAAFAGDATVQPDGTLAVVGQTAAAWAYYSSLAKGDYGFVAKCGQLTSFSRDPALAAAIAAGQWTNNYLPATTASIFAASTNYSLLQALTQIVPTAFTLAPVADLVSDLLVAGPWDRLVVGGLLQKYGNGVNVPLRREPDYDWAAIFPQADDSWGGGIVTPVIDVYQERVDLAKVKLLGASIVGSSFPLQSFTSFSQVLEATTPAGAPALALPGDDITLVAQVIDTTRAGQTPVIRLSPTAFGRFQVFCEDMYGALVFETSGTAGVRRKVALDGFLFETLAAPDPATGRYVVDLSGVLSDAPDADTVSALKQSIQFSVVAGEAMLQARGPGSDTVRGLERSYLLWLAGIIPADTQDLDLAQARARALYLANDVANFSSDAVSVPYFTYAAYNKYVGDMVAQAQTLQSTIGNYQIQITNTINTYKVMDSIDAVNANIKQIGGVLTQYFQALAAGRAAMDGYYDSIITQLDQELQQTLSDITDLTAKLQAQQAVINSTNVPPGIVQRFQNDYAAYSKDEIAKAVMTGVSGLFDLGLAVFGIPAAAEGGVLKALEAFKKVYDKLQAVMQVLKALEAVEKAAAGNVDKLNQLSGTISTLGGDGNLQMPSQVDLQAVSQNVQAALANVPTTGKLNQDKADLVAAVNTLVNIGTALLQARARASSIIVERANTYHLKTINSQQQAAMDALTNGLHLGDPATPPSIASIDLIGVTGQLQYQLKQVLLNLARTLALQDAAIQFEFFGQPSAITSFSLLNLLSVISAQDQAILNGIQSLNPQPQAVPQPITITITGVAATRLTGTNVFQFPVHLCAPEFYDYDMVRIDRVVPNIKGVSSTAGGNYEIHLSCQGQPFQDRDYQRQARTFVTNRRNFGPYVYEIDTGAAKFGAGTGTFADLVTHLTPFSLWQISLPGNVANNQGIVFDSLLVDIELQFHVTAHYDDPLERRAALVRRARRLGDSRVAAFALAASSDSPSLDNLEAQMYQNQAVLQKWDAVFNVLEGPVNAFLYQQFQQYVSKLNPGGQNPNVMNITAFYCEGVQPFQKFWFTNVTKLAFQLSNPLLQFVAGNDSVTVVQNLLSGVITTGTMLVTQTGFDPSACQLVDGPVNFTAAPATGLLTLNVKNVFTNNMPVLLSSTGTLPAPLQPATDYWIVGWTASAAGQVTLQLAAAAGGPPITLTDAGSGTHTIAPDIDWAAPVQADVSKNPYIQGSVALAKVAGIVTPPAGQGTSSQTYTVLLDFPTGAFTLNQFVVNPPNWDPAHHAVEISNALANYYATHEVVYQVQTLNYTNLNQDPALTPSQFALNALVTNAGNRVLQILIATTGDVQHAHTITLNEPIPYDPVNPVPGVSDFTVSLMVSSKLMFQHIFVESFNQGGTNIVVAPIDPGKDFEAWSAQITSGSAKGPANFSNPYNVDGTNTNFRVSASTNDITWDLSGLTFQRTPSAGVALAYSNGSATTSPPTGGTTVNFQYQQWIPPQSYGHGSYVPGHWGSWRDASAVAYITMDGNYPLEVTGSGAAQQVKFSTLVPTINFSKASDLKPATGCQCNDNAIKIALLNSLGASVPTTLKNYIQQVTFKPISVFALENLLFPADQLITLQQARVPGDLLVVGGFLPQVRQTAPAYNVTISAAAGAKGVFGTTPFQNGQGTGSATQNNLPKQFAFQYGPANPAIGNLVNYTIDIEAGTVSPALMVVVVQPDPVNNPQNVILLPPGYGPTA